jgi:hypothetical protein
MEVKKGSAGGKEVSGCHTRFGTECMDLDTDGFMMLS